SSAPDAARPWPMPPPRAARPMPRPAPSEMRPKLLARPWSLTALEAASASPWANAMPEIVRMTSRVANDARILMVRFMGFPSLRRCSERRLVTGSGSVLLVFDRHPDVDHRERAEDQRLDQAHEEAQQEERQRYQERHQREERHHDLVVGEHVAHQPERQR